MLVELVLYVVAFIASSRALPEVQIGETTLIGTDIPSFSQEFFGGIPFAEPPVGDLRLSPPVSKLSLNIPKFNAKNFGAACPQETSANVSEDCLTINIFRPAGLSVNDSLPVMAWIYGGGFIEGSASTFNGSAIVAQSVARGTPIIYVNFNYRVGPLGFPQGPEAAARGALNLGLHDQMAALQWVQTNIGHFRGDKRKVTVFGESAGAISLAILFLHPDFSKLARAAIFESGSATSFLLFGASRREIDWQNFVSAVPDCKGAHHDNSFECLKSANLSTILNAGAYAIGDSPEEFPFVPVIDGPGGLLPAHPSKLWADGTFARVPFITGTNKDEGTAFTPMTFNSTEKLREWIVANNTPSAFSRQTLEGVADRMLSLYPNVPALGCPFDTGNDTFGLSSQFKRAAAVLGDVYFHAPRRAWIEAASKHNVSVKTYGYLFTDPQTTGNPALGVTHGSELPYVYGALVNATLAAHTLSRNMIDYWVSFATSLDPNDNHGNKTRPQWPEYNPTHKTLLELNGEMTRAISDTYRQEQISYICSKSLVFHH